MGGNFSFLELPQMRIGLSLAAVASPISLVHAHSRLRQNKIQMTNFFFSLSRMWQSTTFHWCNAYAYEIPGPCKILHTKCNVPQTPFILEQHHHNHDHNRFRSHLSCSFFGSNHFFRAHLKSCVSPMDGTLFSFYIHFACLRLRLRRRCCCRCCCRCYFSSFHCEIILLYSAWAMFH